jgi:DNA anti-recombination protein RmuC
MSSSQPLHQSRNNEQKVSSLGALSKSRFQAELREAANPTDHTDWYKLSPDDKKAKLALIVTEALEELSCRPSRVTRAIEWSDRLGVPFSTVKEHLRASLNEEQRRTRRSWTHQELRIKDVQKLIRHLKEEFENMRSNQDFVPLTAVELEQRFRLNKHLVLECINRAFPDESERTWRSQQVLGRNSRVSPENRDKVLAFVRSEVGEILERKRLTLTPVHKVGKELGLAYQTVNRFISTLPSRELEIYKLITELQLRIKNEKEREFFPQFIAALSEMQSRGCALPLLDEVAENFTTWRAKKRS